MTRAKRGAGLQRYTIQRGLDDRHPDSYEEHYNSLTSALERIKVLKATEPQAEFRVVSEHSWNGRGWTKMWNEKGEMIHD